jgi:tripartite-type tricarboxylate transporter receptor subunit TctC
LIVGFPPGGGADVVARLIGQWLSERLGQSFVIENRPGAGSNLAAEAVVRAPPDGYTLLLVTSFNAINATFYDNLNFNLVRDIAPVAGLSRDPQVMEVNPSVPVKTVPEFIAYAKANPGKLIMGSPGNGSPPHVAGELFKTMTGVDMVHVHIRADKLRALAVTAATRSEVLPDLPTVGDFLPGYEASNIRGVGAPSGTPTQIIEKLNKEINAGLANPKIKARLTDLGDTVLTLSPAEFGKLITDETEKWGKVVRSANIKAD